jgi:ribose transport system substrate-binding protein
MQHFDPTRRGLVAAAALSPFAALADYAGMPRTFLWNPGFNDMVDTAKFKKSGPVTIGFANASRGDLWLVAFAQGVEWAVSQAKGQVKKFVQTDANGNASKQINDIQDLVNQKIDILIVNPAAADPLDPVLQRVMKQGIPVVTVARRPKSDTSFVSFVTASDQALARLNATWLAERLGGKGNIVLLPGLAGASPAEMRLKAAKEVFAQYPGLKVLDTQYTGWSPANGKTVTAAMIQKFGKTINGVWADSGLQGSGAVEAFLGAGVAGKDIPPITGGDLNRMYKLAAQHGFPFCGIDYTPSIGIRSVGIALDVLAGRGVPKVETVNFQVVVSEGHETTSVKADVKLKDYVRMDGPDDLIMGHGMGATYNPKTFKVDLPV